MPNRDGTGPNGKGSKTGRQLGNCANAVPIERGQGRRRAGLRAGLRNGQENGFGRRHLNNETNNE